MPDDDNTKWTPGTCPKCGSRDLRRLREGENEFVIVPKRECRACGTVFVPPPSILFVFATLPLGLILVAAAVGVALFGQRLDDSETIWFVGILGFSGLMMLVITVQVLRQRQPKLYKPRREQGDGGGKPWAK